MVNEKKQLLDARFDFCHVSSEIGCQRLSERSWSVCPATVWLPKCRNGKLRRAFLLGTFRVFDDFYANKRRLKQNCLARCA